MAGHVHTISWISPDGNNDSTRESESFIPPKPQASLSKLPRELRYMIYSHCFPSNERTISLTDGTHQGPSLTDCLRGLCEASPWLSYEIHFWHRPFNAKHGYVNSSYFGLLNPRLTKFIIEIDPETFNRCGVCSWKSVDTAAVAQCNDSSCPKSNMMTAALAGKRVSRYVYNLELYCKGVMPDDLPVDEIKENGNYAAFQLISAWTGPNLETVDFKFSVRPFVNWWDTFWNTAHLQSQMGEHPHFPVTFGTVFIYKGYRMNDGKGFWRPRTRGFDSWTHEMAKRELSIEIPPKLLRVWEKLITYNDREGQ